jgi:hypothetical protein
MLRPLRIEEANHDLEFPFWARKPGGNAGGGRWLRPRRLRLFGAGWVEACGSSPVHKESLACAKHLGSMVLTLTAWVHEQRLTDARITVLAIDPSAHPAVAADGFAFITWHVTG